MLMRDFEQLKKFARSVYESKPELSQILTPEDYIDAFCNGYMEALKSIVVVDLANAQKLIETVRMRAIPGTSLERIVDGELPQNSPP